MLNFPDAPTLNQVFTAAARSWAWDGTKWIVSGSAPATVDVTNVSKTIANGFNGFLRVENTTSLPLTITMPPVPVTSQVITIKDTSGNAILYRITIAGNGKTIDGQTTAVIQYNYGWVNLFYNGVQWCQQ